VDAEACVSNNPIIWGMLASLVVFVVVSLLTPRPSEERTWEQQLTGSGAEGEVSNGPSTLGSVWTSSLRGAEG
jgi:hypothetical protein